MNTPARRKHGTVLGAIKTKPLRVGLPARLDSPCARRLSVPRPGRRNGHSNRTKKLALLNKQGQRVIFCLHPSSRLKNAETLSSSLRTDRRAFHQISLAGPAIIQLREWSRMADDLRADKIRHANRLREQLQRYYPQMLGFNSDLAEEWIFALWEAAPTPAKAARLRQAEVEKLLKRHRIRRIGAAKVLAILKEQALVVAPGVTEAAVAHIRLLIEGIRLFTRQLKEAHRQLDRLCSLLAKPILGETEQTGPEPEQTLVAILQSLPGAGRIVISTLLAEAFETLKRADYPILRKSVRRGPRHPAIGQKPRCHPKTRLQSKTAECRFTTWLTPPDNAMGRPKLSILL